MSNKQTWLQSHAETLTQNIVGLLIGFIILKCFGLSASESVQLQAVIFATSYLRSFLIRRFFNRFVGSQP
ncbi:hypothetical protein A323_gp24 [Acinetobacter phage AP22]|uniref:Uncharacterized protein n=1 Tax=Acinetobacter phage AP22 TaxID=1187128 RepID=I2GUD1_9CAUD|nr:hypothetical protein A323_gp24 [Acinetobacter phage AP22]CCH57732.1 hypothetical protein [Acinetobacter phage AP22]